MADREILQLTSESRSQPQHETILQVALPVPLYSLFDYLPPEGVEAATLPPGVRLRLPFRQRQLVGVLVATRSPEAEGFSGKLRRASTLLDPQPLLSGETLALLRWAADYYRHPLGEVICSALPARLRQGKAPLDPHQPEIGWQLTRDGAQRPLTKLARAPRQASVVALLQQRPQCSEAELRQQLGNVRDPLKRLHHHGWIEATAMRPLPAIESETGPPLNREQQQAVSAVTAALGHFASFLLDGVTGSGKTEVYLQLTQAVLRRGGQVLILVPEIGLTPQLVRRLQRRIAAPLARLHSALAEGERERNWQQARSGIARVVVGTRSAIFTPLPELALILVDEEHDLSYKQQEGFRYSARDLAIVRARHCRCPVVLGSATPALESLYNVSRQRYQSLPLRQRAGAAQPPRLELIDVRGKRMVAGLSPSLLQLVSDTLASDAQVLLFLNRRGYAPLLLCRNCGWFAECRRCDARMTLHLDRGILWCHHCGAQRPPETGCPKCGNPTLVPAGEGTERLESELSRRFVGVPVVRIDRDSTSRKGSFEQRLEEIRAGHHSLLIGTQMLAKGHHLPNVTLVGILDVDQGFYGVDYHAMERMAQTIIQVAGRAGRAERPGRVVMQTRHPDHPLLLTLLREGYAAFARAALEERRQAALPPFHSQALLRAEALDAELPKRFLHEVQQCLTSSPPELLRGVEILGPIPAPMERRAGYLRAHLLLQATTKNALQRLLAAHITALPRLPSAAKVRWSIDVDPMEMM